MLRALALTVCALTVSGCFTRTIASKMGVNGWFRADLEPSSPDNYRSRFEPLDLSPEGVLCTELFRRQKNQSGPLIVLVHGVGGDGIEMERAVPALVGGGPASVFMFRWVPYDERDAIAQRLADGLFRLTSCIPSAPGRLLVVAHSAGGVVSSFAAARMHIDRPWVEPWVTVMTVASPLHGTVRRAGNMSGRQEATFMLDMGSTISGYPAAAPGVRVLHLRSSPKSDAVMRPSGDLMPNDPTIGVPGAPQIDLPDTLDHAGALVYVADRIADGSWAQWLEPSAWRQLTPQQENAPKVVPVGPVTPEPPSVAPPR